MDPVAHFGNDLGLRRTLSGPTRLGQRKRDSQKRDHQSGANRGSVLQISEG